MTGQALGSVDNSNPNRKGQSEMATKTAKRIVTIYTLGGFGTITSKGSLVGIQDGKAGKIVEYTPTGKRKSERRAGDSMVVLDGDHPSFDNSLTAAKQDVAFTTQASRYGSFDPRYSDEHNIFLNEFLAKLDPAVVLIDNRDDAAKKVTEVRKVDDLD